MRTWGFVVWSKHSDCALASVQSDGALVLRLVLHVIDREATHDSASAKHATPSQSQRWRHQNAFSDQVTTAKAIKNLGQRATDATHRPPCTKVLHTD